MSFKYLSSPYLITWADFTSIYLFQPLGEKRRVCLRKCQNGHDIISQIYSSRETIYFGRKKFKMKINSEIYNLIHKTAIDSHLKWYFINVLISIRVVRFAIGNATI